MYLSFQLQMTNEERKICCCSNLRNDDILIVSYRPGLKTGVNNDILWSENNRVRIWRSRRHTSTENSLEHPLPPGKLLALQGNLLVRRTRRDFWSPASL